MVVDLILRGVLLPAGVSLALLVMLARPWRCNAFASWQVAPAIAAGLAAAFWAMFGWSTLPPAESWMWIVYAAILGAFAGVAESRLTRPAWLPYVWRLPLSILVAWLLVPHFKKLADTRFYWVGGLALLCFLLWLTIATAQKRVHAVSAVIVLMASAITGSLILAIFGNNAKFGQIVGMLTASLGAALLVAIWNARVIDLRAVAAVFALVLPPLMFNGEFNNYGKTPPAAFILPAAAPLVLILCLSPIRKLSGIKAALVYLGAAAIPLGSAILLAVLSGTGESYY